MPSIALPVSLRGQLLSGSRFNPVSLFAAGEQGIWLDPSDLTTMFQDRAGTTPVTTPGQTVGLRLDKSKGLTLGSERIADPTLTNQTGWTIAGDWVSVTGGFEKTATTTNSNLAYSQAVAAEVGKTYLIEVTINTASNLIVYFGTSTSNGSTTFTGNGTFRQYLTVLGSAGGLTSLIFRFITASTGSITAVSVKELLGNHAVAPTDAARPTYGIEPKTGRRNLLLATDTMATQSLTVAAVAHTLAFTGTGTVTLTGASIAGPLIGTGASNRVSLTFTPTAASLTLTVVGSVTLAQLELGSTATAYQRVGTAFDVTEAGVPTVHYVQYDGTDDSFSTSSIDFTATNKMSVFAGYRILAGTTSQIFLETSINAFPNTGGFNIGQGIVTANTGFGSLLNTGSSAGAQTDPITVPYSRVATIQLNSALVGVANEIALRMNGVAAALPNVSGTDGGTGNFGNYPLYIGRRANTNIPFNGRDYGIIIVGKTASATEITNTESYLAANTSGVTL